MVVSVEANATRAGVEILNAGGNAVDAAVAVAYALAVTHPSAGNIGGGGFMLIHLEGKPTVALDFRERAPASLTQAKFDAMIRAGAQGPAAAGVPGSVAGLNRALADYGSLPRSVVLKPAIVLARDGHKMGTQQARALGWAWAMLKHDREARRIFGNGKAAKQEGDVLVQPALATTLEKIAQLGNAGFYEGPVADAIVRAMGSQGMIGHGDLTGYSAALRAPLRFSYRGVEVEVMPPASAGGVAVAQILLAMGQLESNPKPLSTPEAWHTFIEVARRAHAERRFGVMDPDAPGYDDAARRKRWLDPRTLLDAVPIDRARATPSRLVHPLYGAAQRELEHTTHFAVSDAAGNVVSCTTTLSAGYGAGFVVPEAGFVMNNSLAAFGTAGDSTPAPERRTTSSMAPTLLLQGGVPIAALGSPGGDTIPNTVSQVILNLIDGRMLLEDAIDAPRLHHGFVPDQVSYEQGFPLPPAVREALIAKGHKLVSKRVQGDANSIVFGRVEGKRIAWGYADPREGGLALAAEGSP